MRKYVYQRKSTLSTGNFLSFMGVGSGRPLQRTLCLIMLKNAIWFDFQRAHCFFIALFISMNNRSIRAFKLTSSI